MHYQGLPVTFIRPEQGQNKRIFEVTGTKKWLKNMKQRGDTSLFMKTNFKLKNKKVFITLNPAAKSKCASKLQKSTKKPGDKLKLFLKIYTMNGEAYFSIRDVESLSTKKSNELQTSMLDYYPKI